jgi:hypothetical protein
MTIDMGKECSLPTSYPMSTGALAPGVKRPEREADHSPSAKVKKTLDLCIHSPTHFHMLCLIN